MIMQTQTRFPRTRASVEAGVPALLVTGRAMTRLEPLSRDEADELRRREVAIEDLANSILDDGRALAKHMRYIQENRLYRAKFLRFEDYCMARWNKTGRRIRQLIDFLGVDEVRRPI